MIGGLQRAVRVGEVRTGADPVETAARCSREIWSGAELRRRLAREAGLELGTSAISDLMSKQPSEVKLKTLAALCTVLKCTPNELLEPVEDQQDGIDQPSTKEPT